MGFSEDINVEMKSLLFFIFQASARKTILISSDGFRWDYYGRVATPGIDQIKKSGVQVKNLINSFATVTFPKHYTLVTGLYEESHGIVDNEMFDPLFNETFSMETTDPKWWQGGEPIWVTAEKNGYKSVCVNWVGCSIPHEGILPSFWNPYDGSISYRQRVDTIVDRLNSSSVDLGLLYFEEPDHSCHMFGPESEQVNAAIRRVDDAIQYLISRLPDVNIIFTADHGGVEVGKDRIVVLEDFTELPFFLASGGAVAHVWPTYEHETDSLLSDLQSISHHQAKCFHKASIPSRLHYSNNRRIAPIVCIARLGWTVVKSKQDANVFHLKGSHGYDSSKDDNSPMRPIFLASGPDIITQRPGDEPLPPFENVHIYPIIAELIGIDENKLPPINGTIGGMKSPLLKKYGGYVNEVPVMMAF